MCSYAHRNRLEEIKFFNLFTTFSYDAHLFCITPPAAYILHQPITSLNIAKKNKEYVCAHNNLFQAQGTPLHRI